MSSHPPPAVLRSRLDAAERLVRMFTMERYTYASISVVAFIALVGALVRAAWLKEADWTAIVTAFGSSGAVAFTGSRVLSMFGRVTNLVFDTDEGEEDK